MIFADGTTFQMSSNYLTDLFSVANSELDKASVWFKANKLTLNVSKTKFILFRSKNMHVEFKNLKLNIGNEEILRIGSDCKEKFFKFVGIYLDEHLSWDHHINHVGNKVASGNYAISNAKNFLPKKVRLTMYNSFFRSYCDYGILAWGGVKPSKLKKITKLQKKCVRNIAGRGHRTHTDPLFSTFNILKFDDLFKFNCSVFMHKYIYGKLPSSFCNFFNEFPPPNRTKSLIVDKFKNVFLNQFPSTFLPKLWNEIDVILKNTSSHNKFKDSLYFSFISKYPPSIKCFDKTCPDCYPPVIYLSR